MWPLFLLQKRRTQQPKKKKKMLQKKNSVQNKEKGKHSYFLYKIAFLINNCKLLFIVVCYKKLSKILANNIVQHL